MINKLLSSKLSGVIWYELKMRFRSWLYWIVFILSGALALFVPTPLNYPSPEDASRFFSDWWLAGQSYSGLGIIMTLLAAFLAADRILRDDNILTKELIQARPIKDLEYVLGKYLAIVFGLMIIGFIPIIGVPIIKLRLFGLSANILPLLVAFLTIYLPPILFISALALTGATFLRNAPAFYIVYAIVWYYDSINYRLVHLPWRHIFNFSGVSPFFAFFSSTALGFTSGGPIVPVYSALTNIGMLLVSSTFLLVLLVRLEKNRRRV